MSEHNIPVQRQYLGTQCPRTSVWGWFRLRVIQKNVDSSGNFSELAGFQVHNHSSLHMQMAGRNTWCITELLNGACSSVPQRRNTSPACSHCLGRRAELQAGRGQIAYNPACAQQTDYRPRSRASISPVHSKQATDCGTHRCRACLRSRGPLCALAHGACSASRSCCARRVR